MSISSGKTDPVAPTTGWNIKWTHSTELIGAYSHCVYVKPDTFHDFIKFVYVNQMELYKVFQRSSEKHLSFQEFRDLVYKHLNDGNLFISEE